MIEIGGAGIVPNTRIICMAGGRIRIGNNCLIVGSPSRCVREEVDWVEESI